MLNAIPPSRGSSPRRDYAVPLLFELSVRKRRTRRGFLIQSAPSGLSNERDPWIWTLYVSLRNPDICTPVRSSFWPVIGLRGVVVSLGASDTTPHRDVILLSSCPLPSFVKTDRPTQWGSMSGLIPWMNVTNSGGSGLRLALLGKHFWWGGTMHPI